MGTRVLAGVLMMAASSVHPMDDIDCTRLMLELPWQKRVLLVFAPDYESAGIRQQDAVLEALGDGLVERDMTVIRAFANNRVSVNGKNHEQSAASFYQRFAVKPGEFRVILVGKNGMIKLDRNSAVTDHDLFELIDSMPMRRHEMLQDG